MYYTRQERAKYYDCDNRDLLRMSSAMKYMQQTSSEQLDALGFSVEKMYDEDMVFLLSKMNIRVHRMPVCSEQLVIGTAPIQPKGPRFIREFIIDSAEGERLISAVSLWILVDPATRKIHRPASFPYALRFEEPQLDGVIEDFRFPREENPPAWTAQIPVQYSHIDVNQHVNNTVYADFVCDLLPYDEIAIRGLERLSIAFQNEAHYGDIIETGIYKREPGHYHLTGLHGGAACFEAYVVVNKE